MNDHPPKISQISISFLALVILGFAAFFAGYSKTGFYGGVTAFLSAWFAGIGAFFLYASYLERHSNTLLLTFVGLVFFFCGGWLFASTLYRQ